MGGGAVRRWAALDWRLLLLVLLPWAVAATWLTFLRLGGHLRLGPTTGAIICFAFLVLGILGVIVQMKTLRSVTPSSRPTALSRTIMVLAALPPLGAMLLFGLFAVCDARDRAGWGAKRFTPDEWRSATSETKHFYVNDLLRSNVLAGRTPDEVKALLGTPGSEKGEERWDYTLKPQDCSVDHWLLSIEFDRGRVNNYGLSTD